MLINFCSGYVLKSRNAFCGVAHAIALGSLLLENKLIKEIKNKIVLQKELVLNLC